MSANLLITPREGSTGKKRVQKKKTKWAGEIPTANKVIGNGSHFRYRSLYKLKYIKLLLMFKKKSVLNYGSVATKSSGNYEPLKRIRSQKVKSNPV